jgi:hypothetical protein
MINGVQGVISGIKGIWEAGLKANERIEDLRIGFKTAGLSGTELDNILKQNAKTTMDLSNKYAISKGTIDEFTARYLKMGGTTEDLAQKQEIIIGLTERAGIGYESAAKMLEKTDDPEVAANLTRLGIKFDSGATSAERMAILSEKLGGTLDGLAEKANGPAGEMVKFDNSMASLKATVGLLMVEAVAPLINIFS